MTASYLPREARSWADPRGGQGCWKRTPAPASVLPSLVVVVALLLGMTLWLGLVVAGRTVMCDTHHNSLSYCHKTTEATR